MDNRIGRKFLHPGPGYGGSCFPKDTRALTTVADQFGVETRIVDAVIEANERQRDAMIPKIEKLVGDLSGKRIGVLGLSFKPETDDMRESPAIQILHQIIAKGATVCAFDPVAMEESKHYIDGIEYAADEYERSKMPTLWSSLPNGTSFVLSIWRRSRNFSRRQRSPIFAISMSRTTCVISALNTSASAVSTGTT